MANINYVNTNISKPTYKEAPGEETYQDNKNTVHKSKRIICSDFIIK